jgi:hypothetical protein
VLAAAVVAADGLVAAEPAADTIAAPAVAVLGAEPVVAAAAAPDAVVAAAPDAVVAAAAPDAAPGAVDVAPGVAHAGLRALFVDPVGVGELVGVAAVGAA